MSPRARGVSQPHPVKTDPAGPSVWHQSVVALPPAFAWLPQETRGGERRGGGRGVQPCALPIGARGVSQPHPVKTDPAGPSVWHQSVVALPPAFAWLAK